MEVKYLVIGFGISKKGKPFSRMAKIVEFEKDGSEQGFVDLKQCVYADELFPIGDVRTVTNIIS